MPGDEVGDTGGGGKGGTNLEGPWDTGGMGPRSPNTPSGVSWGRGSSVKAPSGTTANNGMAGMRAARGSSACGGTGYRSFRAFKRAQGKAGKGMEWHHVVEQNPTNMARFGSEAINNTNNLVKIDAATHRKISGFYSSKATFTKGQTVRQWVSQQPYQVQQQFGLQTMKDFGVTK